MKEPMRLMHTTEYLSVALPASPLTGRARTLPLSLIGNRAQRALGWPPLLLWRRGTGRGGRDSCNLQDGLKERSAEVGQWPKSPCVVEGFLPTNLHIGVLETASSPQPSP